MPERLIALDVLDTFGGYRIEQPEVLRLNDLDDLGATVIPQWIPEKIPLRNLLPIYYTEPTVTDTGILLQPDQTADIVWFAPTHLNLLDFTLTVRREQRPDGSVAVTGGSAVLSVSVYSDAGFQRTAHERVEWAQLMASPRAGVADWAICPHRSTGSACRWSCRPASPPSAPLITESPLAGSATIAVELTESGVLTRRFTLTRLPPGGRG